MHSKVVSLKTFSHVEDVASGADFIDAVYLRRWITIKDEESVREVLVNDSLHAIEECLRGIPITQSNAKIQDGPADEMPIVAEKLPLLADVV